MGKRRVLATLGVSGDAEDAYRVLLAKPGASIADLRNAAGLTPGRLRSALAELERKAMITRLGGHPVGFQPAPPDDIVEALISTREGELKQARLAARELAALLQTPPEQLHVTELVEILTSRDGVAARWTQLQKASRNSMEVFTRPPLAQEGPDEHEPLQESLIERGVAVRALYDQDALRYPGAFEHLRRMAARGERVRIVSRLPLKLALFDRRVALVPLYDPENTVDSGLVVNRSALLDALVALFEIYWQSGTPVSVDEEMTRSGQGAAREDVVLTLLAGGLKDEAIAHQLGVSPYTVRRRIAAVMERLGTTTRFQAGLALGREASASAGKASHPRQ